MKENKSEKDFDLDYVVCTKDMFHQLEREAKPWRTPIGYDEGFRHMFLEGKALVYINGLDDK